MNVCYCCVNLFFLNQNFLYFPDFLVLYFSFIESVKNIISVAVSRNFLDFVLFVTNNLKQSYKNKLSVCLFCFCFCFCFLFVLFVCFLFLFVFSFGCFVLFCFFVFVCVCVFLLFFKTTNFMINRGSDIYNTDADGRWSICK